jgi:hypothetical protein
MKLLPNNLRFLRWSGTNSTITAVIHGLSHQLWMADDDNCGAIDGMNEWQEKPKYWKKTYPSAALDTADPKHDVPPSRNRGAAVGSRRLTRNRDAAGGSRRLTRNRDAAVGSRRLARNRDAAVGSRRLTRNRGAAVGSRRQTACATVHPVICITVAIDILFSGISSCENYEKELRGP